MSCKALAAVAWLIDVNSIYMQFFGGTRRLNRYLRQSKVRSAPRHFYTSTAFAPTECPGRVLSGFANRWSQCENHNQVYQPSQVNAKLFGWELAITLRAVLWALLEW